VGGQLRLVHGQPVLGGQLEHGLPGDPHQDPLGRRVNRPPPDHEDIYTRPPLTTKTLKPGPSVTRPSRSSMIARSAPADLPCSVARSKCCRLSDLIFGSRPCTGRARVETIIARPPVFICSGPRIQAQGMAKTIGTW